MILNLLEGRRLDEKLARLRAHRKNIQQYRRLLKTESPEIERVFIMRRLDEENEALHNLEGTTCPLVLPVSRQATSITDQGGGRV